MANRYSQIFTLTDIFNDKRLRKKVPLINYREKRENNGKVSRTTRGKTVIRLVYDTATSSGRHYYKPLNAVWSGNNIDLGGTLAVEHIVAYNGVLQSLQGIKQLIEFTANNADIIRDAIKESAKQKSEGGQDVPLYLRVQSIEQIAGMSKRQLQGLMDNIMENIYFDDRFAKTQKKYGIQEYGYFKGGSYKELQKKWELKVGKQ